MSSTNRSDARDSHKSDYYVTPVDQIIMFLEEFLKYEKINRDCLILDPCGGGDLKHPMSYPEALKSFGFQNIVTLDIREDSLADIKSDFLLTSFSKSKPKIIITNPPFNNSIPIIKKALREVEENGFVIMLQRLNFLGGVTYKKDFWDEIGLPKYIFVHRKRMSFTDDGKTDSIEYAHYIWQKKQVDGLEFSKLKII